MYTLISTAAFGPSARAGSRAQEVGKQGQATFNGAPLGLPSKDSSSVNLVLLVAAHHCKRDHFLRKEKNKVTFSSRKTSQETKLVSKVLGQAVFGRDFHGMGQPVPDAPEQRCLPGTWAAQEQGSSIPHTCPVQNQHQTRAAQHLAGRHQHPEEGNVVLPQEPPQNPATRGSVTP